MKKIFSLVATLALCLIAGVAHASKMDPLLRLALERPVVGKAVLGKAMTIQDGVEKVDVLIKSSDPDLTAAEVEAAGGTVRSIIGDIMTAFVPVSFLPELAEREEVSGMEASTRMRQLMDSARANTGVDQLQAGTVDGTHYDGKNVVVGAIDSGLDFSREDFDESDNSTRVQYLRFQSVSNGTLSATECAKDYIDNGNCSISATNDSQLGHGTHVMGIAAGNGGGTDFIGMAPEADIMMVRNDFDDSINEGSGTFSGSLLDGVVEIFKKSDILDKPAVINISQGTHIGAHDNTSLMEQGINNAVLGQYDANGRSFGRAVAVAAGNEHIVYEALDPSPLLKGVAGGIHAPISVPNNEDHGWRFWTFVEPYCDAFVIDMWLTAGQADNCTVAALIYNFSTYNDPTATTTEALANVELPLATDGEATDSTDDHKADVILGTDSSDSQNNKPRALFVFGPGSAGTWDDIVLSDSEADPDTDIDSGLFLDVVVRASGGSCSGDMWVECGGTTAHFLKGIDTGMHNISNGNRGDGYTMRVGDNDKSVGLPGTASGVITVGSYLQPKPAGTAESKWTDINGFVHDATDITAPDVDVTQVVGGIVGDISRFSSIGRTADNRLKPDLLAPGDPVISVLPTGFAVASKLRVDSTHYKLQGTSQATPMVAGIVALMFQKNNTLTADQVKNRLITTATLANTPDASYGYGLVQAVEAIEAISSDTSGYSGTGNLSQDDLDGGGGDGTGCGTTIVPAPHHTATAWALILLPWVVIVSRRWW